MEEEKEKNPEQDEVNREQIDEQNKLLRTIFIISGAVLLVFLTGYLIIDSMKHFEYRGVTGDVVDEIAPYRIGLPVIYKGERVPYYFYLRNDPRDLEDEVPFTGKFVLTENMVINMTEDFGCEGDGIIAIANLLKLYKLIETNVIRDENASCDEQGKYMFVNIQEGNETNIEKFGPACYNINVNNCEILKATERFMYETFVEVS